MNAGRKSAMKRRVSARKSRLTWQGCASLILFLLTASCTTTPIPKPTPIEEPPPITSTWAVELKRCTASEHDGIHECPTRSLSAAWQSCCHVEEQARIQRIDLIACQRDRRADEQIHKVRLAAAESAGNDWWIWLLAGVAAGAAAVGGVWVGTSF